MSEHQCDECGKAYATRSGLWKHKQSKHSSGEVRVEPDVEDDALASSAPTSAGDDNPPSPPADDEEDDLWSTWEVSEPSEQPTEAIPAPIKIALKPSKALKGKKLTKAQQKAMDDKSVALLKMGLTGVDSLITIYGRAVTADEDYSCRHSDGEKQLVADAQLEALKEKGIQLPEIISPTAVAVALTAGYIVPPVYKVQKNAKRKFLKNSGRGILSRIPIIGRRFRKKEANPFVEVTNDD